MAGQLAKGVPGSGKTYECVIHHIYPALKMGRFVVTNLSLRIDKFRALDEYYEHTAKDGTVTRVNIADLIIIVEPSPANNGIPFSVVDDFKRYEHLISPEGYGVYYAVDECHKALPAQSMTSRSEANVRRLHELDKWFSEHRQVGADFLLITQHPAKCYQPVITLVQYVYSIRKLSSISKYLTGTYSLVVYDGYPDGPQVGGVRIRKYKPEYFCLYYSHVAANALGRKVVELNNFDRPKIWHNFSFWVLLVMGIFAVGSLYVLKQILAFGKNTEAAQAQQKQQEIEAVRKVRLEREQKQLEEDNKRNAAQIAKDKLKAEREKAEREKQEEIKRQKELERQEKINNHPYYGYKIIFTGQAKYVRNDGTQVSRVYFAIYDRQSLVGHVSSDDLEHMGYGIKQTSWGYAKLTYLGEELPTHITLGIPNKRDQVGNVLTAMGGDASSMQGKNLNQHTELNRDTGKVLKPSPVTPQQQQQQVIPPKTPTPP